MNAPMVIKPPRLKTCKVCKAKFIPARPLQMICSPICAYEMALATKARRERKEARDRKEKLKTRSDYIKEVQIVFNKYIRLRDADKTCICCGQPLPVGAIGGGFDCGHYRSVGSAPHLRFDERNAHGQRKQCNRWGSGRAVDYRLGLIARIGQEAVDAIEADQTTRKYTVDELKALKAVYAKKVKELIARRTGE